MLPNLVVIGAAKCGTTSLHRYLSLHPEIFMSQTTKEPGFFVKEQTWSKGVKWYESLFPEPAKIRGESSTSYTKYPAFLGVPERMHALIPDANLIYIVRDPIDQMISHYMESRSTNWTDQTFNEAFANLESNYYIRCASYFMQIEQFLKYYSRSKILIIESVKLKKDRKRTLSEIFDFLKVDNSFFDTGFLVEHRKSAEKRIETRLADMIRPVRGVTRLRLMFPSLFSRPFKRPEFDCQTELKIGEILRDDVQKMRKLAGKKLFEGWNF